MNILQRTFNKKALFLPRKPSMPDWLKEWGGLIVFMIILTTMVTLGIFYAVSIARQNTQTLYNSYHYLIGQKAWCYLGNDQNTDSSATVRCTVTAKGTGDYLGYWCSYINPDHNIPATYEFSVRDMKKA